MHRPNEDHLEIDRLRKTLRDLAALTTLPAVRGDLPPAGMIDSLAGVRLDTLMLDVVRIDLPGAGDIDAVEVIRTRHGDAQVLSSAARAAGNDGAAMVIVDGAPCFSA